MIRPHLWCSTLFSKCCCLRSKGSCMQIQRLMLATTDHSISRMGDRLRDSIQPVEMVMPTTVTHTHTQTMRPLSKAKHSHLTVELKHPVYMTRSCTTWNGSKPIMREVMNRHRFAGWRSSNRIANIFIAHCWLLSPTINPR